MGLLLAASTIYVPHFIRKRKLEMLFTATADAFQVKTPSIKELPYDNCLKLYALFTGEQAGKALQHGNITDIRARLFQNACKIGGQFRVDFNIKTPKQVMQMGRTIYKLLKIDFHGEPAGNIEVKSCFFSPFYSREVCRLISSLDEGLLAGLSGGGKLVFSQRITEGKTSCRAYLEAAGKAI